jgi:hypothetical protein
VRTFGVWELSLTVKRLIAIIFILLLSAQCVFKLSIITYFEANRDFIAEVLCVNKEKKITTCYGQCFLDRHLAFAEEDNDDQTAPASKIQVETSIFLMSGIEFNLNRNFWLQQSSDSRESLYAYDLTHTLFHPPC